MSLPMENSPPGIQTIPSGALSGAGISFGLVEANDAAFVENTCSFPTDADSSVNVDFPSVSALALGVCGASDDFKRITKVAALATRAVNAKLHRIRLVGVAKEVLSVVGIC